MTKTKTKLNQTTISNDLIELLEGWQHNSNQLIEEYQQQLIALSDEVLTGCSDIGKLEYLHLLYRMRSLLECMKLQGVSIKH